MKIWIWNFNGVSNEMIDFSPGKVLEYSINILNIANNKKLPGYLLAAQCGINNERGKKILKFLKDKGFLITEKKNICSNKLLYTITGPGQVALRDLQKIYYTFDLKIQRIVC